MRAERQYTVASISLETLTPTRPGGGGVILPTLPTIAIATSQYTAVNNGLTATLAAEVAIDFTEHFGVVPEIRAHAARHRRNPAASGCGRSMALVAQGLIPS